MTLTTFVAHGCLLLAQSNRITNMGKRFRVADPSVSVLQIVGWSVLAVVVILVVWRVVQAVAIRDGRSYTSPKRLFRDLCRLHGLDWPNRRLLRQIAKANRLDQPAHVFLQPALFDTAQLKPPLKPFAKQIRALGKKLFAPAKDVPASA